MASRRPAIARAARQLGRSGSFEVIFVAGPQVSVVAIRRRGIVFDAQFVPGVREATSHAMLYVLLEGGVEVGPEPCTRHDGPCALLFDEEAFEGVVGRPRTTFRNFGEPLRIVEVRIPRTHVPAAQSGTTRIVELPEAAWASARRLASLPTEDVEVEAAGAALLAALFRGAIFDADLGWPVVDAVPGSEPRTVLPADLHADKVGSLDALAEVAGVSLRSVTRGLELFATMFRSPFTGWRETTRRLRLKLAVMALSTEDLSIGDVARAAGFGSLEAMARAFRDAEAPAPSTVRQALHASRKRLVAGRSHGGDGGD